MITAERARELLDGATPGPWWWRNTADVYLQGAKTRIVMAFARRGMNSAQPMFLRPGGPLVLDKVADRNINDYADARLIAAAPDLAQTVIALSEGRISCARCTAPMLAQHPANTADNDQLEVCPRCTRAVYTEDIG